MLPLLLYLHMPFLYLDFPLNSGYNRSLWCRCTGHNTLRYQGQDSETEVVKPERYVLFFEVMHVLLWKRGKEKQNRRLLEDNSDNISTFPSFRARDTLGLVLCTANQFAKEGKVVRAAWSCLYLFPRGQAPNSRVEGVSFRLSATIFLPEKEKFYGCTE